jgi:hypothetical protein
MENYVNLAWGSPIGFNYWKHDQLFLIGAFIYEDVVVTAYQVNRGLNTKTCGNPLRSDFRSGQRVPYDLGFVIIERDSASQC